MSCIDNASNERKGLEVRASKACCTQQVDDTGHPLLPLPNCPGRLPERPRAARGLSRTKPWRPVIYPVNAERLEQTFGDVDN